MGVKIPKALVENYARSLGTLSDGACKAVAKLMNDFEFTDDIAESRNRIQNLMKSVLNPYMDVSVRMTVEFYNIVREWSLGERLDDGVSVDEVARPEATDGAVRAFMQEAVDGKPENIAPLLMERTAYELKRSAMDTMMALGEKDLVRVRFARVPGFSASYGDGCMFCKMLSSRGFVYLSEDTAESHVHANCTCVVVPGFAGDKVEGYDPQAIGAQWEQEMNDLAEQRAARNGTTSQQEYDKLMRNLGDVSRKAKEKNKAAKQSFIRKIMSRQSYGNTNKAVAKAANTIHVGRPLGANARNFKVVFPGHEDTTFVADSDIVEKRIFAGAGSNPYKELRVRDRLSEMYGGNPKDWKHVAGTGWIFNPVDGKIKEAEVHWMQNDEIDAYEEFWFKGWVKK